MSTYHLAVSVLSCVLVMQLLTTQLAVSIPEYSHGIFSVFTQKKPMPKPFTPPLVAVYTAQSPSYDSLTFVGDVLLARNVEYLMNTKGAPYPFAGLALNSFSRRPAVVGNFEASIPTVHVPTPAKMLRFSVAAALVPALPAAGFTHLSLANNHTNDFGGQGIQSTVSTLEKNGLTAFGRPQTLDRSAVEFVRLDEVVIALIAVHTLERLPTYSELKEVFTYAAARSDFQAVYVHWGTEYTNTHNTRQREAAERFVDAGADLVVGHHPHVVQDIQLVNGVPVFYSLGNYIFDQYDSVSTQEGLLLHLELATAQPRIALVPVSSVGTLSQPHLMSAQKHAEFLAELAERSDAMLSDFITAGQILIDIQVASSSKVAMISQ